MCLFLEMLWVKKYRNLSVCVCTGGIFPCHSEYFPCAKNLELPFFTSISGICENITNDVHEMK